MKKTRIDWAGSTWNPVTGCLHGCEYCYAEKIAQRFGMAFAPALGDPGMEGACKYDSSEGMNTMLQLEKPYRSRDYAKLGKVEPYPMGFLPTFHAYKLKEPIRWVEPLTIFVCSMADLFGDWVPDAWIKDVFDACQRAPWHRYLFLTKNPSRYDELIDKGILPEQDNMWYGTSCTDMTQMFHINKNAHTFLSNEPMLAPWLDEQHRMLSGVKPGHPLRPEWVIIGAETGNRKGKVIPERWWVEDAVKQCRVNGQKVFMKESLRSLMGSDFVQEFPW